MLPDKNAVDVVVECHPLLKIKRVHVYLFKVNGKNRSIHVLTPWRQFMIWLHKG